MYYTYPTEWTELFRAVTVVSVMVSEFMVNARRSGTSDDSAKGSSTPAGACEYLLKLEQL